MKTNISFLKMIWLIMCSLVFIAFISGCDVNNSDDPGVIIVPFEMVIPVNQMSDGTWNVSNGMFSATFKARENVTQYEVRVVREDKSKGDASIRSVQQMQQIGDNLRYSIVVGTTTFYLGVSEAQKDQAVAEFQQALNERKHLYHSLEVTPL